MADKPVDEILQLMDDLIKQGAKVYVKWTCPSCGDRCVANTPNTFYKGGFMHESRDDGSPCGTLYTGNMFGIMAHFSTGG